VIDILFLVLPDSLLLDLAGPAEAFRIANQQLRHARKPPAFSMRFVGPLTEIDSSVGLSLSKIEALPGALPPQCWVVVLGRPGSAPEVLRRQRPWLAAREWLARVVGPRLGDDTELLSVCVGALLAADAGLVGTRCVTTHHELLDDLARLAPAARVQANRVFVEDGPLLSSAGITAGIDLALHLITRVCGPAIASAVAQVMVAFTRRGPQDALRSPLLAHRDHLHPAVHRVQDAVCAAPGADWTAERLAASAHVTPRHLARLFHAHVRLSPRAYVEHVRRGLAQHALAGGASTSAAAQLAGFDSPRRLRQALSRQASEPTG
jgi:transcriptional regulator GlxA family with amidase domain